MDALFFATEGRLTVPLSESREAELLLTQIKAVVDKV